MKRPSSRALLAVAGLVLALAGGVVLFVRALPESYYEQGQEYLTAVMDGRAPGTWAMCDEFDLSADELSRSVVAQRELLDLPNERPEMLRGSETAMHLQWSDDTITTVPVVEEGGRPQICPDPAAVLGEPE